MERRASVSIPCNSPRNPDWIFLSRVLEREVRPDPQWDDAHAVEGLRSLLFEARDTKADRLFAGGLDLRTDETANAKDLPGLGPRFMGKLFTRRRDAIGIMHALTTWNPAERYFSDYGQECIDRAIADERRDQVLSQRETALRIGGLTAPKVEALKDTDPMPFGRDHRDKPMRDVPAAYLDWACAQFWIVKYPEVEAYVLASRKAIDAELGGVEGKHERDLGPRQLHSTPVQTCLRLALRHAFGNREPDPIAKDLLASKDLPLLDAILKEWGITPGRPVAGGFSSLVVEAGPERVLRVGLGRLTPVPVIPEVNQPFQTAQLGHIRAEVYPKAHTDGVTEADVAKMQRMLAARGFAFSDPGTDNLGFVDGQLVVIDPVAITKVKVLSAPSSPDI